ncbi:pyrroline-5-carboxylate reductase ProI [Cytobacillus sp. IB215316]|uniref:pyrroline-5-carboxylate reductase ProI n=1 Tax=Cytobacillus sp. IB215316 TaxID=3097354 RepID=UPI002A0B27C2|nr:pyrroline-5-carboxylate reductase ProI [Cytobacillus sp. IB215316]MDX8359697.1 pyrroline-5-carboxylate reductase ProI [Cytobacillus sp. IB215316]
MSTELNIAFIGAGSMAEALIAGMVKESLYLPKQISVTNRSNHSRLVELSNKYGVTTTTSKESLINNADVIVLAMKPKDVAEGLSSISKYIRADQLIISLLAGVSTTSINELLQEKNPVIRAMPNTSATIGKSATALAQGTYSSKSHLEIARTLFETVGIVTIVAEDKLHAVTGLSGSGPAYVYYLVEAMENASVEIGLDKAVAKELILQTIIGAAEMLKTSEKQPATLRREVTSPGGTTEAGIQVLEQHQYQQAVIACIKRATDRSTELGAALTQLVK